MSDHWERCLASTIARRVHWLRGHRAPQSKKDLIQNKYVKEKAPKKYYLKEFISYVSSSYLELHNWYSKSAILLLGVFIL
jgi:hypothetical protein